MLKLRLQHLVFMSRIVVFAVEHTDNEICQKGKNHLMSIRDG